MEATLVDEEKEKNVDTEGKEVSGDRDVESGVRVVEGTTEKLRVVNVAAHKLKTWGVEARGTKS